MLAEILFYSLLFIGLLGAIAVVCSAMMFAAVVGFIFRMVASVLRSLFAALSRVPRRRVACRGPVCGADNPGNARFCRRCGRALDEPEPADRQAVGIYN